ncbi:MAG TPA: hypothetical protein VFK84_11420 [Burkholderiales bacterium]|nr:hypothetical protein [Burkholderiales bacterium]
MIDVALHRLPEAVAAVVSRVVATCLEIRSVWRVDLAPEDSGEEGGPYQLLAFADAATLQRLRKLEDLHRGDVHFLVSTDGDAFETAWGPTKLSGSLGRWAWREGAPGEAFYSRSSWTRPSGDTGQPSGQVSRVRRKALLAWAPH